MLYTISLITASLCALTLLTGITALRRNHSSYSAMVVASFVGLNTLGLSIAPYAPLSDIKYLGNPTFLISNGDEDLYLRQCIAHWIFMAIAIPFVLITSSRHDVARTETPDSCRRAVAGVPTLALFMVGLFCYYRYFIEGPGLGVLMSTRLDFASTQEAVAHRSAARDVVLMGNGAYLASLASKVIFPAVATVQLLRRRSKLWFPLCLALSLSYALQTRQKSPVLAVLLVYGLLLAARRVHSNASTISGATRKRARRVLLLSLPVGVAFYSFNFGLSVGDSIQGLIARLLLIPATAETNFFAVFPASQEWRGISAVLQIPLRRIQSNDDIGIYDVAKQAVGDTFSTNASFLAVGWSGAGYLGVALVSILLMCTLNLVDKVTRRFTPGERLSLVIPSTISVIALISGGIVEFLSWGGVTLPVLITLLATNPPRKRRHSIQGDIDADRILRPARHSRPIRDIAEDSTTGRGMAEARP